MQWLTRHVTRCAIAGIVALLPIGGLVLSVVVAEKTIADSGLADQPWYFPGMGLIAVGLGVYFVGLFLTTFLGKWIWRTCDRVLDSLPMLGTLYGTLKQILGYGQGRDAIFQRVVLVKNHDTGGEELGLVTNEVNETDGSPKLIVFVPSAPTPTNGRVVLLPASLTREVDMTVNEALKALVSVGKTDVHVDPPGTRPRTDDM